ncbi:MarR family transcriptional regulator [Frondihabitans sucicola]|uniref:MarR family transcriptional regulator n=1 Tax=Frondihabitans sucicola TaxID=1268041 RepID=A0ABM8GLU5_9MICO|nr:MarR family transcriptional regulator [Frondihabitans sucicola]BDZ49382.1 MarR family transcriptional regulator [Frondihabitans sucicola]
MSHDEEARSTAAAVHVAISLFTRRARESKSAELSLPERTALSRLDRNGPDTTAGLARWEEISPQAMGVTVSALESKGLLARSPDPQDGRRAILTITPEGVEVVRASRGRLTDRLASTLDEHFSSDEMELIRTAAPVIERLAELL